MLVMRPLLISLVAAHTATSRHHASTTTDHADDEQYDAHNHENILQIHIRLQTAETRERSTMLIVSPNIFGRAPLIEGIYLFTKLALFLYRRYGADQDSVSIDASADCGAPAAESVVFASVPVQ